MRTTIVALLAWGCAEHPAQTPERPVSQTIEGLAPAEPSRGSAENSVGSVPIYGGTLEVLGEQIVVADPGADLVWSVDARSHQSARIALEPGAQPFRVAIAPGVAYVSLRGAGQVLALDLQRGVELGRVDVCPAPRGIALEAETLWVACATGELAAVSVPELQVDRIWHVDGDLRDVVIDEHGHLWVSRFRAAEVLRIDPEGGWILQRERPDPVGSRQPGIAWRMRADPGRGVLLLHQALSIDPIGLGVSSPLSEGTGAYSGQLWSPEVTSIDEAGVGVSWALAGGAVVVDALVMGDDVWFAATDGAQLQGLLERTELEGGGHRAHGDQIALDVPGTLTSLGQTANGRVIAWLRHPSTLLIDGVAVPLGPQAPDPDRLAVEIFHRDAGSGIACATCHPEGGEDGHTWRFLESDGGSVAARRTQSLAGGVLQRAPLHWDGTMPDLDALMGEVFEARMGGEALAPAEVEALGRWLDALPAPRRPVLEPERHQRGLELFEDPEVGCAGCHGGPQLSDHQLHDVGTGEALKTPSLIGVGARGPWLHSGCAESLQERFEPRCGAPDAHGRTSHLSGADLDVLIDYLSAL